MLKFGLVSLLTSAVFFCACSDLVNNANQQKTTSSNTKKCDKTKLSSREYLYCLSMQDPTTASDDAITEAFADVIRETWTSAAPAIVQGESFPVCSSKNDGQFMSEYCLDGSYMSYTCMCSSGGVCKWYNNSSSGKTCPPKPSGQDVGADTLGKAEESDTLKVQIDSIVDVRDEKKYKTVKIGSQTWMAENLDYETADSYCYEDNPVNCTKYGRLYTWAAALDACPSGWHLPDRSEWCTLFNAVDNNSDATCVYNVSSTAANVLKSTSDWKSNGNGIDTYSFSALAAGRRTLAGAYDYKGKNAYFWSSTDYNSSLKDYAGCMFISYAAFLDKNYRDYGFSVRCLKD